MVAQDPLDEHGFLGLDINTKYCLVDTMVLLPLVRGDADVIGDAKRELNGAILVLLRQIVREAARKHAEQEGEEADPDGFASALADRLESAGISFRLAKFEGPMAAYWRKTITARKHPNLSDADYALLCAAARRPRMDVMTDDRGLAGSIRKDRGRRRGGRIRSATQDYRKRRGDVAGLIRYRLAGRIPEGVMVKWSDLGGRTEFSVDGGTVVSVDHDGGETRADLLRWGMAGTAEKELAKEAGKLFAGWKPKLVDQRSGWYGRRRDGDAAPRARPRAARKGGRRKRKRR